MIKVPDALSLAAMRYVTSRLGRRVGGSTGTNFVGVLAIAQRMRDAGMQGSIVTILCDSGERYSHSYYNPAWYEKHGVDITGADHALEAALAGAPLNDVKSVWSRGGCG
jgi:cysteine synthase